MANVPRFRNLKISLVLVVCYLSGMVAAYFTTELVRFTRGSEAAVSTEQGMAQVVTPPKP